MSWFSGSHSHLISNENLSYYDVTSWMYVNWDDPQWREMDDPTVPTKAFLYS